MKENNSEAEGVGFPDNPGRGLGATLEEAIETIGADTAGAIDLECRVLGVSTELLPQDA